MQVTPPIFPLCETAFSAALRTGHGRAVQQIEKHGADGLENLIVEACVNCVSYDPQCEAARAPWLFSIVQRAQLSARVVQAIAAIERGPAAENHRDIDQRCALLKGLADAGSEHARRLLYSSFARAPGTASVTGIDEIIALDGLAGVIHVARQLGRWLQADADFRVDGHLDAYLDANTGVEGGLAALEREAAKDPDVASYLAGVNTAGQSDGAGASTGLDRTALTADEIVAMVEKSPKDQCYWLRGWGAKATSDQLEIVFAALLESEQPEQVKRLLRCFAKIGVPRFERQLLQWIDHPDEQLQWAVVTALSPITHCELRQAAKELIAKGDISNGVALLVNNFADDDFSMCANRLPQLDDNDETHHLVGRLLDLCETHPGEKALDCLLYVYEFSPCSTCRCRAVTALMQTNTTPDWVRAECTFDAEPETRILAGEGD